MSLCSEFISSVKQIALIPSPECDGHDFFPPGGTLVKGTGIMVLRHI